MALSETSFALLADAMLNRLADMAEIIDEEGLIESDLIGGILTVTLPSGRQFVVNRHLPTKQLWLSSPLSGGLHFDYEESTQSWEVADGRRLDTLLKAEIETLLADDSEPV